MVTSSTTTMLFIRWAALLVDRWTPVQDYIFVSTDIRWGRVIRGRKPENSHNLVRRFMLMANTSLDPLSILSTSSKELRMFFTLLFSVDILTAQVPCSLSRNPTKWKNCSSAPIRPFGRYGYKLWSDDVELQTLWSGPGPAGYDHRHWLVAMETSLVLVFLTALNSVRQIICFYFSNLLTENMNYRENPIPRWPMSNSRLESSYLGCWVLSALSEWAFSHWKPGIFMENNECPKMPGTVPSAGLRFIIMWLLMFIFESLLGWTCFPELQEQHDTQRECWELENSLRMG